MMHVAARPEHRDAHRKQHQQIARQLQPEGHRLALGHRCRFFLAHRPFLSRARDDLGPCRLVDDLDAERRIDSPLYQFTTTNLYASGFAGVSMGIARGLLDAFTDMAKKKTAAAQTRPMRRPAGSLAAQPAARTGSGRR